MRSRLCNLSLGHFVLLVLGAVAPSVQADVFQEKIEPFAKKYFHTCHNKKQARGELDLTRYARDGDVTSDFRPRRRRRRKRKAKSDWSIGFYGRRRHLVGIGTALLN